MSPDEQRRFLDFIDISASQLSVVTINVQDLMPSRGEDREKPIDAVTAALLPPSF